MSHDQPQDHEYDRGDAERSLERRSVADRAVSAARRPMLQTLEKQWSSIAEMMPPGMSAERQLRLWRATLLQNPAVLNAEPRSVLVAISDAVRLGFEPGGYLGQCYIQTYKDRRGGGKDTAVMVPGYRGMVELAGRHGVVITAGAVYATDYVKESIGSPSPLIIERPWPPPEDRGEILGGFAIARSRDGQYLGHKLLSQGDMARARRASKSNGGRKPMSGLDPWEDVWVAKTAIRQLSKMIPQAPELQALSVRQEYAEQGIILEGDPLEAFADDSYGDDK